MQKESGQSVLEKDGLGVAMARTMGFAKANKQKVILGLSVAALLLVLASGYGVYAQKANRDASMAFEVLKTDFQHLVETQGRKTTLNQWLEEAPSSLEKMKGRASVYDAALLWYAGLAFESGDYESASAWYGLAAKGFHADLSLKNISLCGEGHAFEQQGNGAEAARCYETIRESGSSVKQGEATFHLARIKEAQGDISGAKSLYLEIVAGDATSHYKDLSTEKVAGL